MRDRAGLTGTEDAGYMEPAHEGERVRKGSPPKGGRILPYIEPYIEPDTGLNGGTLPYGSG
jgi:hypothetical protein